MPTTEKSELKALVDYFNVGDQKVSLSDFNKQLKELTPEDKTEMAQLIAEAEGFTLKEAKK